MLQAKHTAVLRWIGIGLAGLSVLLALTYQRDMKRAFARVDGKSTVLPSRYGGIEYTDRGAGIPVLVIHGSGGGYDQGELIAEVLLGDGFRAIAPSRFGYLRSTFQDGATFDEQAHAYAALLDHLGIQKVAVVTISHGGPSALLFALNYPERVSSLTLISAGVVTAESTDQGQANQMGSTLSLVYRHNWLYWGLTNLLKKQFMELMGANQAVIRKLTPEQMELVERVIVEMNPVSLRTDGVTFDNQATLPGARIAGIQAPTLILHAADDTLQLYHNAEFAAGNIPEARLRRFESGGHLLFAVEQDTVRSAVQAHIQENAGQPPSD
jgi:pimeloyl-ACP methyl ester carboxylesterase